MQRRTFVHRSTLAAFTAIAAASSLLATPVVAQGTLPGQRVVCATLATLAEAVAREGLQSPALTIVGEVVKLRDELAWFHGAAAGVSTPTLLATVEA